LAFYHALFGQNLRFSFWNIVTTPALLTFLLLCSYLLPFMLLTLCLSLNSMLTSLVSSHSPTNPPHTTHPRPAPHLLLRTVPRIPIPTHLPPPPPLPPTETARTDSKMRTGRRPTQAHPTPKRRTRVRSSRERIV
jgi:hypothetical protein